MSMTLQDKLTAMRNAALRDQQREHEQYLRDHERRCRQYQANRDFMLPQLREAQPWEYAAWLKGHLLAGGTVNQFRDHPMTDMWVALADLRVRPTYGAFSFDGIIIPEGIREDGGDTGHTDLYIVRRMKDSRGGGLEYVHRGFHDHTAGPATNVPAWSDTEIIG